MFTDGGFEDFRKGEYAGTRADAATGTVALTRIEGTRCPVEGTYTSMIFDAGRTTTFGTATWTADVPAGTSLRLQVAVSSTASGPWVFVGPDGTAGSYFTSSGTAFTTPPTGRYVCYRAPFASDAARLASPTLSGFNPSLGGATSRVVSYTYAAKGNVISRTTVDYATGTTTDVRDSVTWPASDRINTQDQLLRRDVTSPDGTAVTWRYTCDSASNMTSKTDGTQTTSYAWESHNRLVQVTVPDGTSEAYTYDGNGLMLSSRKSTDTAAATYVWRGNDLVQETAPDGTVTRYNVVNGVLTSFVRGGETYTVQSDATVGHVRSVTDSNGTVVYTARYDAWGNVLAVTDNVPGGMPARYVGALGVRWDGDLGVYCMRHRWYDPQLQQFLSTDPLKSNADLYEYANDAPIAYSDSSGQKPMIDVSQQCPVLHLNSIDGVSLTYKRCRALYQLWKYLKEACWHRPSGQIPPSPRPQDWPWAAQVASGYIPGYRKLAVAGSKNFFFMGQIDWGGALQSGKKLLSRLCKCNSCPWQPTLCRALFRHIPL